jgi:tRNA pseudouridine13 synthase
MRLKTKPQDFRVHELLNEGVIGPAGEHRVYLVHKRKQTSFEAAAELASLAGVTPADVSMAGLKDRQGVTVQHMSVRRGKELSVRSADLKIETLGWAAEALTPEASRGNRFDVVVRELTGRQITRLRSSLPAIREFGYPNYFDEQRFGNLRHRQGWIMLDLLRGDTEGALRRLLASASPFDSPEARRAKEGIWRCWGDWGACRDHAGRFGKHHSVFEHLRRKPDDWAGAFHRISTRERLIHLYAFQSHLWNLAVESWFEENLDPRARFAVRTRESRLVFPRASFAFPEAWEGQFPLPGNRLEEVQDPQQLRHLRAALAKYDLTPDSLFLEGVPGFALKHELRPIMIVPGNLKARPIKDGSEDPELQAVEMRFELPRGAYATMLVRRLVGPSPTDEGATVRTIRGRVPGGGRSFGQGSWARGHGGSGRGGYGGSGGYGSGGGYGGGHGSSGGYGSRDARGGRWDRGGEGDGRGFRGDRGRYGDRPRRGDFGGRRPGGFGGPRRDGGGEPGAEGGDS